MSDPARQPVSYADFLAAVASADERLEFEHGSILAMSGAAPDHELLTANWIGELHTALRGRPCRPYGSNLRTRIAAEDCAYLPDVTVVCGERQAADDDPQAITNPTLVVEVLSPSSASRDRGIKFRGYRALPSLQHYALVHVGVCEVELFSRNPDGSWTLRTLLPGDAVPLPALDITLSMDDLYAGWAPPPPAMLVREWGPIYRLSASA